MKPILLHNSKLRTEFIANLNRTELLTLPIPLHRFDHFPQCLTQLLPFIKIFARHSIQIIYDPGYFVVFGVFGV